MPTVCSADFRSEMFSNIIRRFQSTAVKKRFYKNVTVISGGMAQEGNENFEICLDNRKLKTPKRNVLKIPSEPLALAVATEWESQHAKIDSSKMHLTGLCMSTQDNPMNMTKESLVDDLIDYLRTDTVFFLQTDKEQLKKLQDHQWGTLIAWANEKYRIQIEPTSSIHAPDIPQETIDLLRRHLLSYNFWALVGYQYGVHAVKSLLITMATLNCRISVDDAVKLTLLESDFQADSWGRVEWAHDIELHDITARFAAAVLFVQLNTTSQRITLLRKEERGESYVVDMAANA